MQARQIGHMFGGLTFKKTSGEIIEKAKEKIDKIETKIKEREARIKALRTEHQIEDSDLIQLLTQARKNAQAMTYSYSTSKAGMTENVTIGAGVVNNLLTENDFIEAEKDQVRVLERIVRNLRPLPSYAESTGITLPDKGFTLTPEELDFLEF